MTGIQTNSEIHIFNRHLKKITKVYNHVTIVEPDLNRKHFTQHGMHLNKSGKEWLSKLLATQINRLVKRNVNDKLKIALKWKDESVDNQSHFRSTIPPDQTKKVTSQM